jgi:hypothetical protein
VGELVYEEVRKELAILMVKLGMKGVDQPLELVSQESLKKSPEKQESSPDSSPSKDLGDLVGIQNPLIT